MPAYKTLKKKAIETSPFGKVYSAPPRLYLSHYILSISAMKLHLPRPLFRALLTCLVSSAVLTGTSFAESADSVTYTTHQDGPLSISGYAVVSFEDIQYEQSGAAIAQLWGKDSTKLLLNDSILFTGNTSKGYGGAIDNSSTFSLNENGDVVFIENTSTNGGAIFHGGGVGSSSFTLSRNGDVLFIGNSSSSRGGAIYNANAGKFELCENGNVTFSGNLASYGGGAIYTVGNSNFTLTGNGDVLFEKNAEVSKGVYRLRSIYSQGTLNLSASEGKRILFKDSVYAYASYGKKVTLNQDGAGDIIFTGATTEADLLAVKGEVGTDAEISRSQISQFLADVTLGGGSLQVQEGAKVIFDGLSVGTASQSASLQMGNGWVDVMKPLTLSESSSLSLYGCNFLLSGGITAEGNNTLNIQLCDVQQKSPSLTVVGALENAGNVVLNLGDISRLKGNNYHILHVVGDSAGWSDTELQFVGASASELT